VKRATSLLTLLIITAVGLGACSGSTATPAASAGSPPLGTYTAQVGSPPNKLTLLDGGRYRLDIPIIDTHPVGTWTATPAQLSFTESPGGPCSDVTGTYTWSYTGTALHLTVVNDACTGRPDTFGESGGWVKQP
jgi:hypothetical protein